MVITTQIPSLPTPPDSNDKVNFRVRADAFLSKLPIFADKLNTYAREANSLIDEAVSLKNNYFEPIVQIHNETLAYRNETLAYRNETLTYRNDAVEAKEAIQNYVIPDEATYSIEQIDALTEEMEDSIFLDFKF